MIYASESHYARIAVSQLSSKNSLAKTCHKDKKCFLTFPHGFRIEWPFIIPPFPSVTQVLHSWIMSAYPTAQHHNVQQATISSGASRHQVLYDVMVFVMLIYVLGVIKVNGMQQEILILRSYSISVISSSTWLVWKSLSALTGVFSLFYYRWTNILYKLWGLPFFWYPV